jgi:hypothetical protein
MTMSVEELRVRLTELIERYPDAPTKVRLVALANRSEIPTKGILVELSPFMATRTISDADRALIDDIAFYFC